jgi:NDP-sugar pyrophosphorylase family protein
MTYRKLDQPEINQLIAQGCQADDWDKINVITDFETDHIHQVHFSGDIELGSYGTPIEIGQDLYRSTGLRNAYIKNCTIKNNVYISNIKSLVNYTVEEQVVIDNVDRLMVTGETTFANGLEIEVLNEGGGREVPIFDQLTSQIAYLLATYRHDLTFIKNLKKLIFDYVLSKKLAKGRIDQGAQIIDCGTIKNVNIGAFANLSGTLELTEGTIVSKKEAPTTIGHGVIAKSFIIHTGSKVNNAALIEKTFIGQGVQVGRQFSSENSLIFANSECFHSEACSIYAGPYTVTHHKSTLLIAAMFSFYNAGSGSNQSNHMYKLGPIHQGILERGAKTGSFSYLLWPSRIGAFSVVIGKHYSNFDNSDLPFSYILESEGKSLVIPALNFFTVGTKRDSSKWPNRDRRKDTNKLDILNFDLLSPYIIGKILKAIDILQQLKNDSNENERFISFMGQVVENKRIDRSIQDYQIIIDLYIGDQVIKKVVSLPDTASFNDIKLTFNTDIKDKTEDWVDVSGMICPSERILTLAESLDSMTINSVKKLHSFLRDIHNDYERLNWSWCVKLIFDQYQTDLEHLSNQILIDIISAWQKARTNVNQRILEDAGKEFAPKSRIGYGLDGDSDTTDQDFENVIGRYEDDSFVKSINEELVETEKTAEKMISFLHSIQK